MSTDPLEIARRAVHAAFDRVPRPPDAELLHPDCADATDLFDLYPYAGWRLVPDVVIERAYAAMSFLSAAGYRHFLPAYLDFVLRHPDGGAAAVSSTIWSLQPDLVDPPLAAFARSKYALLDRAQREAIVGFLEAMAPYEDTSGALAEWRGSPP